MQPQYVNSATHVAAVSSPHTPTTVGEQSAVFNVTCLPCNAAYTFGVCVCACVCVCVCVCVSVCVCA